MRWPPRNWLLVLLAVCTAYALSKLVADDFPFKGWAHFGSVKVIDRERLGYTQLPSYDLRLGQFGEYGRATTRGTYFGYCYIDRPLWPDGVATNGAGTPLPPLVQRTEIRAAAPCVVLVPLGLGWMGWALLLIRHRLNLPAQGPGFEVGVTDSTPV